jgi:hypothetical protein
MPAPNPNMTFGQARFPGGFASFYSMSNAPAMQISFASALKKIDPEAATKAGVK